MFVLEKTTEIGPNGCDRRVIDHETGTWIQPVASHGSEEGLGFRMWYRNRWLVFDTRPESIGAGEDRRMVDKFTGFGCVKATYATGITSPTFVDRAHLEIAMRVVAEALLVFGSYFDGDRLPIGYHLVELTINGRPEVLSRRDFAYMMDAPKDRE